MLYRIIPASWKHGSHNWASIPDPYLLQPLTSIKNKLLIAIGERKKDITPVIWQQAHLESKSRCQVPNCSLLLYYLTQYKNIRENRVANW